MDTLSRSRSHRRLYSGGINNATSAAGGRAGHSSSSSTVALIAEELHPALARNFRKAGQILTDAAAQAEWANRRWVWVTDAGLGYTAGWIISEADDMVQVACVDDKTRTVSINDVSKMNPPKFDRVEDIADLTNLNEASVVHNLRERYTSEMIYTYSGPFLVAVNPYRPLPIYGQDAVDLYKGRRREECPPHVFAVAERAWQNMVGEREGQSILITGESGAGKTENTKKVIQYLTAIAAEASHALPPSGSTGSLTDIDQDPRAVTSSQHTGRELENQIIQANPILEAFGNAQTVRNNNSSRFGKFVRILFTPLGAIAGATIDWYLLEKSRVTARSAKERSFHVFYQLLKGGSKDLRKDLLLSGEPEDYSYLKCSRLSIEGVDDHSEWRALQHALNVVGFNASEQFDLFRVLAAILHIGNIVVTADRSEQAYIRDNSSLEKVCHLLGLPVVEFTKALLRPRVRAGREWVTQARTKKQVEDEMGALCKSMYEKSFGALVERINKALERPISKSTFIGVLDIAGFEIFETNGFEQLCINYTNEKLQQFFNHHMFVLEQEEYARENIDWQFVNFGLDLQPTIDLIESTSPIGILSCLDEECIMPKASDATFTEKLHQLHDRKNRQSVASPLLDDASPAALASKYTKSRFAMGFTVSHYAGKVEYRTDGWLDKNRDPLNANITSVLAASTEAYVAGLFEEYREDEPLLRGTADSSGTARPSRRSKKGAFRTVAQRHKEQLNTLMAQLRDTQPHFVRCIVPNENKKPGQVNVPLVLDQLRCNGVLEGIRIARLGYPNRLPFIEFRQRYEVLTPGLIPKGYIDGREACQRMTGALDLDKSTYRIGLSKIFFKAGVLAELEEQRDELLYDIFARLQASCRRYVCQRRARKQLNRDAAIRTIQRNARIYLDLKAWPWWMLYTKVRPLLAATRTDEALKRKEAELLLAKERAERDVQEKLKLEELKLSLENESRRVQEALDSERALSLDKDALLARSKEREMQLEEEVNTLQEDLDTLDSQLERALAAQQAGEDRFTELQAAFQEAGQHAASLATALETLKSSQGSAAKEMEEKAAEIEILSSSKAALLLQVKDLTRTLAERDEDHGRTIRRLQDAHCEVQGKLSSFANERDSQVARIKEFESKQRQAEGELGAVNGKLAEVRASHRRKEEECETLRLRARELQIAHDKLASELSDIKLHSSTLEKDLRDANANLQRQSSSCTKLQDELDQLRKVMEAKSTEDVKQREMAVLRDREITDLRAQAASLTAELTDTARRSAEQIESLVLDLDSTKTKLARSEQVLASSEAAQAAQSQRLVDAEEGLSIVREAHSAMQSKLEALHVKHRETEAQLRSVQFERDALDQRASESQSRLQTMEDQVLQVERKYGALRREADNLGDRLEEEITKRLRLEKSERYLKDEVDALQGKVIEHEQYARGLHKELQQKEAELQKALSMQDKTIVEHVHVLEEAKRYTDKQLADTQARLASMTQYSRTLEKTKTRLQAELEDLAVQNDRERLDERAVEKTMRKLEDQAERAQKRLHQEERMRQVAEQDVAKLTAEVQRLRTQTMLSTGTSTMQRSKSTFENVPPPDVSNAPSVNGVVTKKGLIAELEKGAIFTKDGKQDDALRGRILRELTQTHRDLAASMDATLSRSMRH